MAGKPKVKAGQVYREKRQSRYIFVLSINRGKAWCVPCDESGMILTEIKITNLQTRFELIDPDRTEEIDP